MPGSVFLRRVAVLFFLLFAFLSPVAASAQGADELTCDDFTNQEAAQIVLDLDDSYEDTLDEDGDGEACPDLPSRDDNGGDNGSDDETLLNLGLDREVFEDEWGEPVDDEGTDDFATGDVYEDVGDYPTVSVFWEGGFAAHILVELPEELEQQDAWEQSFDLFRGSINLEKLPDELDDGALLYGGGLPLLGKLFDQDVYDEYEVGGEPGDVRVILIPGDEEFAFIDVAIGLGDEYTGGTGDSGSSKGDNGGDAGDADAEEYLATVRDGADQMQQDIEDYSGLLESAGNWTDADVEQMADILNRWTALEDDVAALEAPEGYEEIQQTYEDAAAALTATATSFTKFVTDQDEDALADSFVSLADATSLLDDLDGMLADEGV